MNINKFTQKSMEAVQNCEKLAYEYGNQQIDQPHLLYSLLTLDDSLIMKLITKIAQGVVDGDSHFYIMLEGSDDIFDVSVVDFIDIIKYNVGDTVTVEYKEGERANSVLSLNGEEPDQKAKETKKSEAESEEQALSEE